MEKQTALVAGGSGFVGSHLCETLLDDDYEVICIDNFGSGRKQNIKHLLDYPQFTVTEEDICQSTSLPQVDEIYHLASRASPLDFEEFPLDIALTNTEGTRNLLTHAVDCDATLLLASTSEVYGEPEVHPQPESYNGNVNIRGPRSCYDESKRFGETLAEIYYRKYDLDVRTVRIFNTYGPRMRPNDGRVIPNFVSQAIRGDDLTIYGDGSQTRSFCYVDDLVRGFRNFVDADGLAGEVMNLGNDTEITIKTLAETILDVYDTDSGITYEPLPEDDPSRRRPDLSTATELIAYEPTVDLRDGLSKTIDHFETVVDS